MNTSVGSQVNIFLWSVVGGMLIGLLYDLFRIKRKTVKTGNFWIYFEDLAYWIIVALIMFCVVYYSNDGEIRGFVFIGTLIGVILYVLLLSKIIMRSSLFIIEIMCKVIKTIYKMVSLPIRVVFKIIAIPVGFLMKFIYLGYKRMKRINQNRAVKAGEWRKIFRNIRKKYK